MTYSLERCPFEETGNHNDGEEIHLHWSLRVNWSADKWSALDHNLPTWIHLAPSRIYSRLFSIVISISNCFRSSYQSPIVFDRHINLQLSSIVISISNCFRSSYQSPIVFDRHINLQLFSIVISISNCFRSSYQSPIVFDRHINLQLFSIVISISNCFRSSYQSPIVFDRHINLQFNHRSSEWSLHLKIFRLKYYEPWHLSYAKLASHPLLISASLIWRTVQVAKALSIQFSPFYCYFLLSFDWSYFPRHFVLRFVFFPEGSCQNSDTYKTTGKISFWS